MLSAEADLSLGKSGKPDVPAERQVHVCTWRNDQHQNEIGPKSCQVISHVHSSLGQR